MKLTAGATPSNDARIHERGIHESPDETLHSQQSDGTDLRNIIDITTDATSPVTIAKSKARSRASDRPSERSAAKATRNTLVYRMVKAKWPSVAAPIRSATTTTAISAQAVWQRGAPLRVAQEQL